MLCLIQQLEYFTKSDQFSFTKGLIKLASLKFEYIHWSQIIIIMSYNCDLVEILDAKLSITAADYSNHPTFYAVTSVYTTQMTIYFSQ